MEGEEKWDQARLSAAEESRLDSRLGRVLAWEYEKRMEKVSFRFERVEQGRRKRETNSASNRHLVLIHSSFVILNVRSVRRRRSERFVGGDSILDDSNNGSRDSRRSTHLGRD